VVEGGDFDLLISTQRENMEEFSGLSAVINNHLFSVLPTELKGRCAGWKEGWLHGGAVATLRKVDKGFL